MKKTPDFKSEQEEREFWETHDTTDYMDWSKANAVLFPNLKKTTKLISLRLPEDMIAKLKVEANKRDVPYQALMKLWLNEKLTHLE